MDQRELSLVVYTGLSNQNPNNIGMGDAASSMEQECEKPRVEEMLALASPPMQVQPLNELENINLVDQIVVSLRNQIKVSDSNCLISLFLRQHRIPSLTISFL